MPNNALVVTSIAAPNRVLQQLAAGALARDIPFFLIGDVASPAEFQIEGCTFLGLEQQRNTGLRFAQLCPLRHYARKNIGYLLAMRQGAGVLVETDDDNFPCDGFWSERARLHTVPVLRGRRWVNVYRWFTDEPVWPRGFPLERVRSEVAVTDTLEAIDAPIQQGLAAANPDVDAVYRLVGKLPLQFERDGMVALAPGSWCPFNSQNTTWFADAFPLLYLPAHCSFRMTDIWRSFVAQRIAWENGWSIVFHGPTVEQYRNEHDLLRDFREEVPGYLNNARIADVLDATVLRAGTEHLGQNLLVCYEQLVRLEVVDGAELALLEAWIADCRDCASH